MEFIVEFMTASRSYTGSIEQDVKRMAANVAKGQQANRNLAKIAHTNTPTKNTPTKTAFELKSVAYIKPNFNIQYLVWLCYLDIYHVLRLGILLFQINILIFSNKI